MDKACERIWRAIDEGETIVVFGDYDVDGVTATALLYQHLKGMGATVKCMLPSREATATAFRAMPSVPSTIRLQADRDGG